MVLWDMWVVVEATVVFYLHGSSHDVEISQAVIVFWCAVVAGRSKGSNELGCLIVVIHRGKRLLLLR